MLLYTSNCKKNIYRSKKKQKQKKKQNKLIREVYNKKP